MNNIKEYDIEPFADGCHFPCALSDHCEAIHALLKDNSEHNFRCPLVKNRLDQEMQQAMLGDAIMSQVIVLENEFKGLLRDAGINDLLELIAKLEADGYTSRFNGWERHRFGTSSRGTSIGHSILRPSQSAASGNWLRS